MMAHPRSPSLPRREFLKNVGAAAVSAGGLSPGWLTAEETKKRVPMFVGVHVAAHSLYDEGFDHCLDLLQETAAVNTLLVTSTSYYGAMLRPKEVQADHGVPARDGRTRQITKIWFRPHEQHYAATSLRHKPPDSKLEYAGREVFADLAEPARRRGMKVHERMYEPGRDALSQHVTNGETVLTVDVLGKPGSKPCWNHPEYLGWVAASVKDLFASYPLDGIQYGAERLGPLSSLLDWPATAPSCFCDFCRKRAAQEGVDFAAAKKGLEQLHGFVQSLLAGKSAEPDGAYIGFLRILTDYPEILAWEKMHYKAGEELHALIRDAVKAVKPDARVGRHVDHSQCSWNFLFRAAVPYARMAAASEYLKISTYHEILAPRLRGIIVNRYHQHVLQQLAPEQILELHYAIAGHDKSREPKLEAMNDGGFSPEYVYRETKRAVDGVQGRAAIYAGIATDIPRGPGSWGGTPWPSNPERLHQATRRALDAGAAGIVICREYEENRVESLKAIGRAVRERSA